MSKISIVKKPKYNKYFRYYILVNMYTNIIGLLYKGKQVL